MKAKKKKKAKRVSKIAKGKFAKVLVFKGKKVKTKGGVSKDGLIKNKRGKVVSKKQAARGSKNKWISAVMSARKALGVKGFAKLSKDTPLYKKAKQLYGSMSPMKR